MADNKHLVPVCIIYIDRTRLDTDHEGALQSVRVIDRLNGVSHCIISFDCSEKKLQDRKITGFNSALSVHLGYKDDLEEVFTGEITVRKIVFPEYGTERFEVTGANALQRLGHGIRYRVFERKSPSQAILQILSYYDLQGDVDSFGKTYAHWEGGTQTDLDLVLALARKYGRDVYAYGKTVYVKDQMKVRIDEIIYEWGKSLIHFHTFENLRNQISGSVYLGWDTNKNEEFSASKKIADIGQKIGGRKDWTKISNGGNGLWKEAAVDYSLIDRQDAEEQALSKLRQRSFEYIRADGSGEGNNKLIAGMQVMVKNVGGAYSGEYIAENVTHDFSLENGYITSFGLKRNMVDEAFGKQEGVVDRHADAAYRAKQRTAGAGSQAGADETEDEEERKPEMSNLRWMKDGKEVTEALVDDEVTLNFDVLNINNGERVDISIWEHDDDNEHDHVVDLRGTVQNGAVEKKWKVVYTADEDDGSTSAQELAEKGYTLPEYHFVAKYKGAESEESPVMQVTEWMDMVLKDKEANEILVNTKYTIYFLDGNKTTNTTDGYGIIQEKGLPFDDVNIRIYHNEK